MNQIHILYTCDEIYFKYALVSACSVSTHLANDQSCIIHFIHKPTVKFNEALLKKSGLDYKLHTISEELLEIIADFKNESVENSHWTEEIFFKLFAHEIIPELDKILYLDPDTIVSQDISSLYHSDMNQFALAGRADFVFEGFDTKNMQKDIRLSLEMEHCINAGVLLLNLNHLSKINFRTQVVRFCKEHKTILSTPDEDILNYLLKGKIKLLPFRYNCVPGIKIKSLTRLLSSYIDNKGMSYPQKLLEIIEDIFYPSIVHYIGPVKPWMKPTQNIRHWDLYWKEYNQTILKDQRSMTIYQRLLISKKTRGLRKIPLIGNLAANVLNKLLAYVTRRIISRQQQQLQA